MESKIEGLEKAIAEAEKAMMDPGFFNGSAQMAQTLADCDRDKRSLEQLMEAWAVLDGKVTAASAAI